MHTKIAILMKYLKIELDADLKIILSNYQNNYVGIYIKHDKQCSKNFWHSNNSSNLQFEFLHNYFHSPTKLFSDLYLANF